jgi:hypothetical protein
VTHTPGPWQIYGGAYKFIVARPMPNHKPFVCELPDSEPETEEERANADLIAAAPDLLAALKTAVKIIEYEGFGTDELRAVIAKAEGA